MSALVIRVALFELKKRLGMLSTWIYFGVLFLAGGLLVLIAAGAFSSLSAGFGSERVHANSPESIRDFIGIVGTFGLIISAGVFGQSLHEDVEHRMTALLFSTPLKKLDYLLGRFVGALATMVLIYAGIGLGALIAAHLPSPITEANTLGDNHLATFVWPYVTTAIPNLFVCGALFFSVSALARRMMPVYVAAVVLLVGYLVSGNLLSSLEHETLGALLDPFAIRTASLATKYWTVADKNTQLLPFTGVMLANRAIWVGLAAACLAAAIARFRVSPSEQRSRREERDEVARIAEAPSGAFTHAAPTGSSAFSIFMDLTRRSVAETVKNTYFLVIALAGSLFMTAIGWDAGKMFDTATWPVTRVMTSVAGGTFEIFLVVVIIFSAGEIVWRERDARVDQIMDALPVPTWAPALAKVASLAAVLGILMVPIVVCGVMIQTIKGYHDYELGLYLSDVALRVIQYLPLVALAMALQVFINHKYISHFVMIVIFVALIPLGSWGALPNVALFMSEPSMSYSDMNGYGHFLKAVLFFRGYWLAFGLFLLVVALAFWVRGTDTARGIRFAEARRRLRGLRAPLALALVAWLGLGAYLSVQTLVLHQFVTNKEREARRAEYEKQYKKDAVVPQPRVTGVVVAIDIDPAKQGLRAHGTYTLTNKTDAAIDHVQVTLGRDSDRTIAKLAVGAAATAATTDEKFGVYTFALPAALAPGASVPLDFDLAWSHHGITNDGDSTNIVENGTFFNSDDLPHLGYQEGFELGQDNTRKKYDLAPKDRMPAADAPHVRDRSYISSDADWVTFDITVSTTPDQIALAPGYLQREWTEGDRHFYHYQMDRPILHFFSVLSARYQVQKDQWNNVALEVYYDQKHPYNVQRMIEGMKDALDYCSKSYGPYQHRQLRIAEFPRYASFAQSFPNTIPFSESIGFIARYQADDDTAVDYPYFVTAHETAHQWWAHQVIGAFAQGSTMLSETLAEYTALMVMKHKYGPEHMRRFLKQEADAYLSARQFETKKELPLSQVENQAYLHYNKGGHVMYELQDAIGEDKVDAALASFLSKWREKGPPYPVGTDLIAELRAVASPEDQSLITDLFETITLFDDRAEDATCVAASGGGYDVTMKLTLKKMRAGEQGDEKEVPIERPLEIGAVDDKGVPIVIEKRTLAAGVTTVTLHVPSKPAKVGVDPLVKLLDRHADDNVTPAHCP